MMISFTRLDQQCPFHPVYQSPFRQRFLLMRILHLFRIQQIPGKAFELRALSFARLLAQAQRTQSDR